MTRAAAIDTGTSRNASALAIVSSRPMTPGELRRWSRRTGLERPTAPLLWALTGLWRWQGAPKRPLDIRNAVGPAAAEHVRAAGLDLWACDGFELAAIHHVSEEKRITYRVQGGRLGASSDGLTLGVYEHGKIVIHEQRFVIAIADEDAAQRVVAGLQAIREEPGAGGMDLTVPSEGDSHHDEAVAVLRALWLGGAGNTLDLSTDPVEGRWADGLDAGSWEDRFPANL